VLEGGHSKIAGRLAGAFRNMGKVRIAQNIIETVQSAGYDVREEDPFIQPVVITLSSREISPYVNRMRILWQEMRATVVKNFPKAPGAPKNITQYLERVEEKYVNDAYHSLSIEGYRVSPGLIQRVRSGAWDPDNEKDDSNHKNALAARGYWQAFKAVKKSIKKVLMQKNPGAVADSDHHIWYREMLAPSVTAGILQPADLAGYRNAPVYIRQSRHVPPSPEAVRDLMPTFFELLSEEKEVSARIILGHFFFVTIHPYMDGNGRMGRFLMNVMFAQGGYPWTIVPVTKRSQYMKSLETASVKQDINSFCDFIAGLLE